MIVYYSILYHSILCYVILHSIILYYIILYYTTLYYFSNEGFETQYISEMLAKVKRFAAETKCHVWIVAHPAKAITCIYV